MTTVESLKADYLDGRITKQEFIREAFGLHRRLFEYVSITGATDVSEIRISPDGVSFLMREYGIWLHCPPGEARVAPLEVINFDHYEPRETAVMDALAAGSRNILDVGANIGWYSVRFAKRLPEAHVWAFEPMPVSYSYLQRNIAANGVGMRVSAFNYALSESSGSVQLFIAPGNGTNASLMNVANASNAKAVAGTTLTLDEWVSNYGITPDFIKCDVEGAELLVFRGGGKTLSTCRPVVFAELLRKWAKPFGYHPNDMIRYFADYGYRCFGVGEAGVRLISEVTEDTQETNYAFLHAQEHIAKSALLGIRG